MLNLGLDFGTTTSILSYYDGHRIESFKQGGANGNPYIPSVLSIEKEGGSVDIGNAARLNMGDEDYDVYNNFKMLLFEQNEQELAKRGYQRLSPRQVSKEYISRLLTLYKKESNIGQPVNKLVITVPEIWVREGRHAARESLKEICRELGFSNYKLLSEPVAASVYFVKQFRAKYGRDFNGHVLVCDYGGGTLDLSLSFVEGNKITVLEGTGKSKAVNSLGVAGVAFDEAIVRRLMQDESATGKRFFRLLKEFEEHKIGHGQSGKMAEALERYRKNSLLNKKIFEISDITVTPKDMIEVFDRLVEPELGKALTEMNDYLEKSGINTGDGDNFRVVMVGGFSQFYPVQHKAREFFGSKTEADRRFETCFDLSDTALAISKGAALVANEFFEISMSCPISVGIRVFNYNGDEVDIVIIEKGQPLYKYQKPVFSNIPFYVSSEKAFDTSSIKIFRDAGHGKRRYIDLKGRFKELLPNPNMDNEWQIGFSTDEDIIFTLHIRDRHGDMKSDYLGYIEEMIGGLHIVEK